MADYQSISKAANEIMNRNIRSGNVYIYQVMFEGEYIVLDIRYRGSRYSDGDYRNVVCEAGSIVDYYGVRMSYGIMQDY